MTADDERPAVWVIDPKDPSGATRYPGREHGRFVDDRGEHVIVLFDRGTVRDYRVVSPERVAPRDEDGSEVRVVSGMVVLPRSLVEPARRDPECVARWPEAASGDYDPRCCRFPKSCSANRVPRTTEEPTSDGQES